MIDGIANIDKPRGFTSHDVVARVRRAVGQRKVGHAGTLDPRAQGVLIVLLGRAARLSDHIMGGEKVYRFSVVFGVETDSLDLDGAVIAEADAGGVSESALHAACTDLIGEVTMEPPIFSAIRHEGRKLYELAREGTQVTPELRTTMVRSLDILALDLSSGARPVAEFRTSCSKGTYVRSLAREIARACGTVGSVDSLVRERSGAFDLRDAISLAAFEARAQEGDVQAVLTPMLDAVSELPRITPTDIDFARIMHGHAVPVVGMEPGTEVAVCSPSGRLAAIAVVRQDQEAAVLQPRKVLVDQCQWAADGVATDLQKGSD